MTDRAAAVRGRPVHWREPSRRYGGSASSQQAQPQIAGHGQGHKGGKQGQQVTHLRHDGERLPSATRQSATNVRRLGGSNHRASALVRRAPWWGSRRAPAGEEGSQCFRWLYTERFLM